MYTFFNHFLINSVLTDHGMPSPTMDIYNTSLNTQGSGDIVEEEAERTRTPAMREEADMEFKASPGYTVSSGPD